MSKLVETNKQDDLYFAGSFWIVGDSVANIFKGNFKLLVEKHLVDIKGKIQDPSLSRNSLTHKKLWNNTDLNIKGKDYTYYPRGRVSIFEGTTYIFLPSLMNVPSVINAVLIEYDINKLDYEIEVNEDNENQINHYNFELK